MAGEALRIDLGTVADAAGSATVFYDGARVSVACRLEPARRDGETIEEQLLPRSAFISDAAFNIPASVRELFHDVINLGAKAALIAGNDPARQDRLHGKEQEVVRRQLVAYGHRPDHTVR